ncbi:MAG: DUF1572 family protein [Cyclobacteriaceae bacterium]
MQTVEQNFLESATKFFKYYKKLGEGAIDQLTDDEVLQQPNETSNSIALIVHHISGNMLSRFTDFMTTDGEKPWRNREAEFDQAYSNKKEMMVAWEKGWACLFNALENLQPTDLSKIIYIRNEGQTVLEAIQRQLAHYPHHIGQILYQAKILKGQAFKSLSISKGRSESYNQAKFDKPKERTHPTDKA